jgi:hypothetical protein
MIVRTFRIDGNQRYSWIKNQRSWFREPDVTMQPTLQDNQLMSKHRVLGFRPQLRLEWRGQDGQNETKQPDHSASLGDFFTSSTRIRFSVHTGVRLLAEPNQKTLFRTRLFRQRTNDGVHRAGHISAHFPDVSLSNCQAGTDTRESLVNSRSPDHR